LTQWIVCHVKVVAVMEGSNTSLIQEQMLRVTSVKDIAGIVH